MNGSHLALRSFMRRLWLGYLAQPGRWSHRRDELWPGEVRGEAFLASFCGRSVAVEFDEVVGGADQRPFGLGFP